MKRYKVKIESKSAYMQHRMDDKKLEDWEKNHSQIITRPEISEEDAKRAEFHCYRDEKTKKCYIPSEHIKGALINAGSFIKSKVGSSNKNMKSIVAGQFNITEENLYLPDYDMIDKRSAVNKNIKARVMCVRPKWSKFNIEFTLEIDNDTLTMEMIKNLFYYAGNNIGIGSFRPTANGNFGRFNLVEIKNEI